MNNFVVSQDSWTLAGFFLAGLAVNLTPCVYTMLMVTLSIFKPDLDSDETLGHSFLKSLAYFMGIVLMYSALGYFAASSGKLFGAALQNSWVLGGMAVMMFALALSMFGVFKLHAPAEILHRLSRFRKADYLGFFLSGLFVGIFAAPCIGPPVIALLATVAERGDPQFGLTAFFIFSLGLGLPYLLLGTFSIYVPKLPKAGKWLIAVERLFGVILLGMAAFYLMLALQIHVPKLKPESMVWTPYSTQQVQQSIKEQKPMVIDFYALWCVSCQELEENVFSKQEFKDLVKNFTTLRVDATNFEDPQVEKIIEAFDIYGLPTVVFLDSRGREVKDARIIGAASLKEFKKALELVK